MNSLVKQRIVGAIVLVALGVIFIPMFLTGESDMLSDTESNVPAKPAYELEAPKVKSLQPKSSTEQVAAVAAPVDTKEQGEKKPVPPLPGHSPDQPLPGQKTDSKVQDEAKAPTGADQSTAQAGAKNNEVVKPAATANSGAAQTPAPSTAPVTRQQGAKADSTPPVSATKSTATEPGTSTQDVQAKTSPVEVKPAKVKKEVTESKPAPIVNGYVVQLGSFSIERNATQLRDKLRKAGHASFVEKYTRNSKTSYRVRVGPELTRELAEQLKATLKEQTKINGFIVKYPQ